MEHIKSIAKPSKEEPVRLLADLWKNIARYDEQVNKCSIVETNILAESIGSDINFIKYSGTKISEEQSREIDKLEGIFSGHMARLNKCICVKKIEK